MRWLDELKRRVNIDQRNRILATVISNNADTVTVRMPDGSQRQAVKTDASAEATPGDLVEITTTDRKVLTAEKKAPYRPTGGIIYKSV